MLIGLCGTICSGKSSIASYLETTQGFTRVHISRPESIPSGTVTPGPSDAVAAQANGQDGAPSRLEFPDVQGLLEFVTKNWNQNWVTTDVWDISIAEALSQRPFFLLVNVDAPILARWERYRARSLSSDGTQPDLSTFLALSDSYSFPSSAHPTTLSQLTLHNTPASISQLHRALARLDPPLTSAARLRPPWDAYFMTLASLAASRSNCMKRRVGCVLVSARTRRIISTGYNGTPRGLRNCGDGGCPRCNGAARAGTGLDACLCLHAEENALLEAGRERIGRGGPEGEGAVLYCDTCPCLTCCVKIAQVGGIEEVVFDRAYSVDDASERVLREAGVRLRRFEGSVVGGRGSVVDLCALVDADGTEQTVDSARNILATEESKRKN